MVVDLLAQYKVSRQLTVFGAIKNVADERYITGLRQGIYVGPERSFEMGIRYPSELQRGPRYDTAFCAMLASFWSDILLVLSLGWAIVNLTNLNTVVIQPYQPISCLCGVEQWCVF